jgi:hypothetical protein
MRPAGIPTRQLPAEVAIGYVPLAVARIRARRGAPAVRRYWEDPAGWVAERIAFPEGRGPTPYQNECLTALGRHHRATARGPHGLGKTSISAWVMCWFIETREAAGVDWKVVTTAGSWSQLAHFLWPEFHKWERMVRPATGWREGSELLQMSVKLRSGQAFAVASNRPELIEGAHADQLLYIYDEAKSILPATFDASEGAFAGAGVEDRDAFAWAGSTPGPPVGRFADIHHRRSGYEDWWVRHVTLAESIAAGRISEAWADQRRRQWGEGSAIYQNRVLGEFAVEDAQSVIPIAWVEAAMDRWRALDGGYAPFVNVGVDVARFGEDRTVLALRHGDAVTDLRVSHRQDTTVTAGDVAGILRANPKGHAVVDVVGLGAGVVDMLREAGLNVVAFNAAGRSQHLDRSGELAFANRRAAGWWNLREMLDPGFDPTIALPPDEELLGDLVTPLYRVLSGGRIAVEGKDDIRKRLGRSTDKGDAVVQAYALPEPEDYEGVVVWEDPVDIAGGF